MTVRAVGLELTGRRGDAGSSVKQVAGKVGVRGQTLTRQQIVNFHGVAERAVGKRAAQAFFELLVTGRWNAPDNATHALGGDVIGVIFAFDEDEATGLSRRKDLC